MINPSPKGKKGVGRREDGRAKPLTPLRAGGIAIPMSPIDLITPEATTQAQPEVIDLVTPPRAKPEEVGVVNFGFSSGGGAVEIDGVCTSIT